MDSIANKFPNLEDFIRSYKGFSAIYDEKKNDGISFDQILTRLGLIDKFILLVSNELDIDQLDKFATKIKNDHNIMKKFIETINKSNEDISKDIDDSSSDECFAFLDDDSSESSDASTQIDDINSEDSGSIMSELDNDEEGDIEMNKMIAKSILELKMRKQLRDFEIEKEE